MAQEPRELPDWFGPVAEDVIEYCRPKQGLWVDLGSGSGGLGFALAQASESVILLIEPNANTLEKALERASSGLAARVVPIVSGAEHIPLPDGSVDLVTSRGSIFFWKDPPQGLREVYRILRPGARALIGGGFGTSYPASAREEFFRRGKDNKPRKKSKTEEEEKQKARAERPYETVRPWNEPRRPEWMAEQARAAGIETALVEPVPPGLWLLFEKGRT